MAVLLRDDWAQLMVHGGPRLIQKLLDRLIDLGAVYDADPPARQLFPEAASDLEADVLSNIARAASPAAIDLLLAQPRLWHDLLARFENDGAVIKAEHLIARSRVLKHLLVPPTVVVVGQANVGKSTLSNQLLGRSVSIVTDAPGTTRDWVGGMVYLSPGSNIRGSGSVQGNSPKSNIQGPQSKRPSNVENETQDTEEGPLDNRIAVRWLDTPGLRRTDDPIEQHAIDLAAAAIESAHVLVALRDPRFDWPADPGRPIDLWVLNKIDTLSASPPGDGNSPATPLLISAADRRGLDQLQRRIITHLGLANLRPEPWAFSMPLLDALGRGTPHELADYVRPATL